MPIVDRLNKRAWPVGVAPGKLAAVFTVVYVVIFGAYIVVSGFIAGKLAGTIQHLQGIEIAKGLLFILLTGTLFFLVNYGLLTRLHRQTRKLLEQENAIIMVERRALAALRASTIAHDLNNVLMCLTGLMAELKKREGGEELSQIMREGVERGIESVTQMSKRMVALSRPESQSQRELLDMRVALSDLVKLSQSHPDVRSCKVAVAEVPAVRLELIQPLLDVAVMNLLINAAQATGRGGRIELAVAG
ncbi:MAG: hypothetical protein HC901_00835, partial [Bdellovibrionaceae bacterium]|nr:hypothetical protein [Pseudobdellovibrionaceae bacterium]